MKVLCVIDMQNDFIDGALGSKEAEAIVDNVKRKIELYRKNGDTVIFTRDTHGPDYLSTAEGKKLPIPHCILGSPGWQIHPDIDTSGHRIFDKPTFGSTELALYLAKENLVSRISEVFIVGVCTDICVLANAMLIKSALPECRVAVISRLCAGTSDKAHATALAAMAGCQIEII